MAIQIAGDAHADEVLTDNPFALLVGMMLDQQYPMEHAFRGGWKVLDKLGTLDTEAIAAAEPFSRTSEPARCFASSTMSCWVAV